MSTTEQLIEEVKLHSILFDLSHHEYRNIKKKDEVWEQIILLLFIFNCKWVFTRWQ
jgi:hypothetical protein